MNRLDGNRDICIIFFSIHNAGGFISKIHHLSFQEGQKLCYSDLVSKALAL